MDDTCDKKTWVNKKDWVNKNDWFDMKDCPDVKDWFDKKDSFDKKDRFDLSPGELDNTLAGRLEDRRLRESLQTSISHKSYANTSSSQQNGRKRDAKFCETVKHGQSSLSSADFDYCPTIKSRRYNLGHAPLRGASERVLVSDESLVTPNLCRAMESCLSAMPQSTKMFRIPLYLEIDGTMISVTVDVYKPGFKSSLDPVIVTKALLEDETMKPETRDRNVPRISAQFMTTHLESWPMKSSGEKTRGVEPWARQNNNPSIPSLFSKVPRPIIEDKPKQVDRLSDDFSEESEERRARLGKKRKNPDDDASLCSESSDDTSDESEHDSDSESENVVLWESFQNDTLPSFLPYIRGRGADTSSPPCGDSPDSGSGNGGSASQDTPASSISYPTGGNGLRGNRNPPIGAGSGSATKGNSPILRDQSGNGARAIPSQPLPLICWYPAAGKDCTAKHIKRSSETRHLWNDHVCPRNRKGPSHRLPDKCQYCSRLFLTQDELDNHIQSNRLEGRICPQLNAQELKEINLEPNKLGVSNERKEHIERIRKTIDTKMKQGEPPVLHDVNTMTLLRERVESNILLYINGSDTKERTAKSELWKWYLIFKELHPHEEVPMNPFTSKQQISRAKDKPRDDALCIFNRNVDQRCKGDLLTRIDLSWAFLDTMEMLGAKEAQEKDRFVRNIGRNARKRHKLSPMEGPMPAQKLANAEPTPRPPAPVLRLVPASTSVPSPTSVPAPTQVPAPPPNTIYNPFSPDRGDYPGTDPNGQCQHDIDYWWQQAQDDNEQQGGGPSITDPPADYDGASFLNLEDYRDF